MSGWVVALIVVGLLVVLGLVILVADWLDRDLVDHHTYGERLER